MGNNVLARGLIAVVLALAALALFLLPHSRGPSPPSSGEDEPRHVDREIAARLDHDIDTVLGRFGIEQEWVRKREVPLPGKEVSRWERRVAIPPDMIPIQMNLAFSALAKRYHGRAVASENSKDNTVTIHMELGGLILQTIILRPNSQLQRTASPRSKAAA